VDNVDDSLAYYIALKNAGVPVEIAIKHEVVVTWRAPAGKQ